MEIIFKKISNILDKYIDIMKEIRQFDIMSRTDKYMELSTNISNDIYNNLTKKEVTILTNCIDLDMCYWKVVDYVEAIISKLNDLIEIKDMLNKDDNLFLQITNKFNKNIGVATFFANGEDKIRVYEGSPDGRDDNDYTYSEFLSKYNFKLIKE